jgi:hypothetical protein
MRRVLIRAGLVVIYVGLGVALFVLFRGHTLLVDNHDAGGYSAPDMITVFVDKGEGSGFFRNDRDRYNLSGSRHTITVEFGDGRPAFAGRFELPIKDDMYILSIPRLLNNEPCVEVFHTQPEKRAEDEPVLPPDVYVGAE